MISDRFKVPAGLIEAAQRRTLVPFVGAGLSRQSATPLPTWHELLKMMINFALEFEPFPRISAPEAEELRAMMARERYLMVAEILKGKLGLNYTDFLARVIKPTAEPSETHKAVMRLNTPLLLTTNFDKLLDKAYLQVYGDLPAISTHNELSNVLKIFTQEPTHEGPLIFKLHGTTDQPDTVKLTEYDYRELIYEQQGYRATLSAIFLTRNVLMLGFSFTDRELLLLLELLSHSLKSQLYKPLHYIFLPENEVGQLEAAHLKDAYGLVVIPFKPSADFVEVLQFVESLPRTPRKLATNPVT
jgi:hypothetical protein